jgi:L-ribulose-5-phosphate 3-epimerase
MALRLPIGAITDEYSPADFERSVKAMADAGMQGAELRLVWGKNIMDVTDDELRRAKEILDAHGMTVVSIASPLLKCVLPDSPEIDGRFQHDVFASKHTCDDQPRLAGRAFEIAHQTGAKVIRVFSFWRTVDPKACFSRIVDSLGGLAERAKGEDLIIGLENEHACNIATAKETAEAMKDVNHPNLKVVWDPANAYISGENPFPDGYRKLDPASIVHVHVKDCRLDGHKPLWGPVGTRDIDWKGQIEALLADGYRGYLHLETHWAGPQNDKFMASVICGENLKGLVDA